MKQPKTVFMEMFSDTNTFASKLVSGRLTRKNMWSYFLDKSHKKDRSQQKSLFIKQKENWSVKQTKSNFLISDGIPLGHIKSQTSLALGK